MKNIVSSTHPLAHAHRYVVFIVFFYYNDFRDFVCWTNVVFTDRVQIIFSFTKKFSFINCAIRNVEFSPPNRFHARRHEDFRWPENIELMRPASILLYVYNRIWSQHVIFDLFNCLKYLPAFLNGGRPTDTFVKKK